MGLILMYKKAEEKAFQPFDFKQMEDEAKQYMQLEGETMKVRFAEKLSFETGEFTLKPEADSILANVIRILNYNPGLKCRVEGHTTTWAAPKTTRCWPRIGRRRWQRH